jgi:tetratricopeptide (TPR) repeat protein
MKATFLSRFTPSMMTPEALEALFVQREALAQRIVELTRDSVLTPSKHHTLLIGPRGIGKTHLISLIYHRLRAIDDLHDRLLIAWLREEEWGVTSFLDLLLRIFRALRAEHDDAALAERMESLYKLPPDAAERVGGGLLKEFVGNRTLLVLVENLDELFKGLDDEGQKRLRAYLQENPFCTILATAQSLFNGVSLQTSPFYGFFRIHHLEELNFDGATRLLTKIADFEGKRDLASFIQTPTGRARIRAVHHLAGGNHRVYVIFSQLLTRESLDELVEPFMRTLDDLTPYYQARMAWLSPQQRKIVEFLCDRRGAVPVKEIAQRCFMTHQTASGQLKILREMSYIRSEAIGRESYYELREPLMRLCVEVKKNRGEPIRLFVDFLRLWYSREELQERLTSLQPDAAFEREYLLHALRATEEETEDPRVAACLKDLNTCIEGGDFVHALQVAEELVAIRGNTWDWFAQGYSLGGLGRYDEALASLDKAIELDPNNVPVWYLRGLALGNIENYNEALASFDKAIELGLNDAYVWLQRGAALSRLGRWDEALVSYNKVVELDQNNVLAWLGQAAALVDLGRLDKVLASLDKVIKLDSNNALAWSGRGLALADFGRYDEALASFDKAIELGNQSSYVFFNRAKALLALDRWDEGTAALDEALHRFAHADEPSTGDTEAIVYNLLTRTHDAATWQARIQTLIELYDKHQVVFALGQGLVRSISALASPMVSDAAARRWRDVWQELAGDHKEFELPLRLLDATVRYRETHDPRVLLELAVEERTLLEPLLEGEKTERREPASPSPQPTQQRRHRSRRGKGEKTTSL